MGNIDNMIKWMTDRQGKVTYSQSSRLGPNSYDCSSAVYFSLVAGGFLPAGSMGWTGTLATTLPTIARSITRAECKRGDIFLSKSQANNGHTGIFWDNSQIIHCSSGKNGIYITPASGGWMGPAPTNYYRLNNTETNKPKKGGDIMLLFRPENELTVYWLVGNRYVGMKSEEDLKLVKALMQQAGFDTHIHTSLAQSAYLKKLATEVK